MKIQTRRIAIVQQKGGSGKTTTTTSLAAIKAAQGYSVLIIDCDAQANSSDCFLENTLASKYNTWHVLKKKCDINEAIVVTNIPGLDIIPGSLDLTTVEWEMGNALKREERLSQAVSQIKKHYDYILFDCGPNLGIIVINAMAAASELLITMETSYYCSSGVLGLVQTIREVQEYLHPTLRVGGILFTKVERTKEAQRVMNEALELFSAWNYPVYQTKIRKNVKLTEAPAYHLGINAYAPDSAGAEDYLALSEELRSTEIPISPSEVFSA